MSTVIKNCRDCGTPVTREQLPADHRYAALLNGLECLCDSCISIAENAEAVAEREQQAKAKLERLARRINDSGLPAAHHGLKLDELDHPSSILDAARRWVVDGGGLLLTGAVGVGKTTIAGAAARERLHSGPVLWCSAPLLFARLGSGFGSEQREWALNLLTGRRALVLDDIDKARPTEFAAEQVFLAIDQRVEHLAPLLVTTNLSPSQLAGRWPEPYGTALASRLVGYCRTVKVAGYDRRLEQR